MGESHSPHFNVELVGRSLIKSSENDVKPYTLPLSNLDRLSGHYPITMFYGYRSPPAGDFASVVATVKSSLSDILPFFPTFTGRVVPNPETGELEVLCNNTGVELVEALIDVPLESFNFYDLDTTVGKALLPLELDAPVSLQLTGYSCGGFSVAWSFDHLTADGAGFVKFLTLWSEMARTKKIAIVPSHDRSALIRKSQPPRSVPSLDRIFAQCSIEEIMACPANSTVKRLFYVEGSSVERLREISSLDGEKRTKTEAVSAHLWKLSVASLDASACNMAWLVDGRPRFEEAEAMSSYIGNVTSMAVAEATTTEVKEGSLARVAEIVSKAIKEVTNEGHFVDVLGWMEGHRSGFVVPKIMLGAEAPPIAVSSCHNMPGMETDFGFGPPFLGTFYTVLPTLAADYFNLFPSGKGDGSWFVFGFVSPRLAAAMESDPDRVFQPVTAAHLGM